MCALSYYFELAGLATTGISLVRENAVSMQPPRSLWVPFPLGRPLGKPGNPAFQHQVIAAALALLDRPAGPVLEDFPLDAPEPDAASAPACPVSFASADDGRWATQLRRELAELAPWYALSRQRRGRTTVGACPDDMDTVVARLAEWADAGEVPREQLRWFKLAIDDARAYYSEALTAQPGDYAAPDIQDIFWNQTRMGALQRWFHDWFAGQPALSEFARIVAPRTALTRRQE